VLRPRRITVMLKHSDLRIRMLQEMVPRPGIEPGTTIMGYGSNCNFNISNIASSTSMWIIPHKTRTRWERTVIDWNGPSCKSPFEFCTSMYFPDQTKIGALIRWNIKIIFYYFIDFLQIKNFKQCKIVWIRVPIILNFCVIKLNY
jgi:hypothetical protein